jgi:hypothetical protein
MSNGNSFFERFRQLFQSVKQDNAPQQTDETVEVDKDGFFFHVACDNCNDHLRLRVTRAYDLERLEEGGYLWRKTIVDGRCFRRMEARVQFDGRYRVVEKEIKGGRFVGRMEWEANR